MLPMVLLDPPVAALWYIYTSRFVDDVMFDTIGPLDQNQARRYS